MGKFLGLYCKYCLSLFISNRSNLWTNFCKLIGLPCPLHINQPSPNIISDPILSYLILSYYPILLPYLITPFYHIITYIMSCHVVSCHVMSGRHVMSYITSYHKTSHRNVLYRIISYYIIYHIPQANYIAAYLYDVTMMYLIALNATVAEEGDPRNGSQLFKNSIYLQFDGIATKHTIMYNSILNDLKFLRNVNIYIYTYICVLDCSTSLAECSQ